MNKKKLIIILCLVAIAAVCITLLVRYWSVPSVPAAVTSAVPDDPAIASASATPENSQAASTPSPSADASSLSGNDTVQYQDNRIEFEYYDVPSDTFKKESVEVGGDSQLQRVMELIAQQFFEQPLSQTPIQPKSIVLKGDSVYIDFNKNIQSAPFGSAGDVALLDAIYNGYTGNIEGVTSVYFSIEGGNYETSHVTFSKDTPYQPKNS